MNSIDWHSVFVESEPGILRYKEDLYQSNGKRVAVKGAIAGFDDRGRWIVSWRHKHYYRYRVIWEMYNGTIPKGIQIDHINQITLDDRIQNLRLCTIAQNQCNRGPTKFNLSGYKGVTRNGPNWLARVQHKGKTYCLGNYSTPELAHEAYKIKVAELHGQFARYENNKELTLVNRHSSN